MAYHEIKLVPENTHGSFSNDLSPVITIDAGDQVKLSTADIAWGIEQHSEGKSSRKRLKAVEKPMEDGPALTGPIAIRQAKPGSVLEILFKSIIPESWGWTFAGPSPFNENQLKEWKVKEESLVRWKIDTVQQVAISEHGLKVEIRPFLGIVGMPSERKGWQSGWFPRSTGGNLDCKYLQEGSVLRLPVKVDRGLLSMGDGHAVQANGEIGGSAVECMMKEILIEVNVHNDISIDYPQIIFENKIITLGFDKNLDQATNQAVRGILDVLCDELDLSRSEALAYAGILVDLEITQIANGVKGVHAVFDKNKLM